MRLAIVERLRRFEEDESFKEKFYLPIFFKNIFDELDIELIPVISDKYINDICSLCDGLILTGSGNDIHPKYYGQTPIEGKEYIIDEYPLVKGLIEEFAKENKPILGICAGEQEINVVFGGSLNQKIDNHKKYDHSKHMINIKKDSFLYEVYNESQIEVNSYHTQSVKDVAPGFTVTAISTDGIVEAIEKDNIIGVQWHPEVVYDMKIFKHFIEKFFNK